MAAEVMQKYDEEVLSPLLRPGAVALDSDATAAVSVKTLCVCNIYFDAKLGRTYIIAYLFLMCKINTISFILSAFFNKYLFAHYVNKNQLSTS